MGRVETNFEIHNRGTRVADEGQGTKVPIFHLVFVSLGGNKI